MSKISLSSFYKFRTQNGHRLPLAAVLFSSLAACQGAFQHDPYNLPIAGYNRSLPVEAQLSSALRSERQLLQQVGVARFTASDWGVRPTREVVILTFRSNVSAAQKADVMSRLSRLAFDSRRPDQSHPIEAVEIGQISPEENESGGGRLVYILHFRSEGDRHYVVGPPVVTDRTFYDPAYAAFRAYIGPLVTGQITCGYNPVTIVRRVQKP